MSDLKSKIQMYKADLPECKAKVVEIESEIERLSKLKEVSNDDLVKDTGKYFTVKVARGEYEYHDYDDRGKGSETRTGEIAYVQVAEGIYLSAKQRNQITKYINLFYEVNDVQFNN